MTSGLRTSDVPGRAAAASWWQRRRRAAARATAAQLTAELPWPTTLERGRGCELSA